MKQKNSQRSHISRRGFIKSTVGAGAVFAQALAVPRVLAASDAAIRIGNINSYTGGLAYAGENNLNGMNLYFDSIGWTIAGRQDRADQGG
jgi:branched-chain amino acid transport system substrate-binding protein